jgi:hypothetical protein
LLITGKDEELLVDEGLQLMPGTTLRRTVFGTLRWGVTCGDNVLGLTVEGETVAEDAVLFMSSLAPGLSLESSKLLEVLESTAIAQ